MGETHTPVSSGFVNELFVVGLVGAAYVNSLIKSIRSAEMKIIPITLCREQY